MKIIRITTDLEMTAVSYTHLDVYKRQVQDADYIYRDEVDKAVAPYKKEHGKNPSWRPNQYFAALTNMRSVGVMGDERTYDYAVAVRAVRTVDVYKRQNKCHIGLYIFSYSFP